MLWRALVFAGLSLAGAMGALADPVTYPPNLPLTADAFGFNGRVKSVNHTLRVLEPSDDDPQIHEESSLEFGKDGYITHASTHTILSDEEYWYKFEHGRLAEIIHRQADSYFSTRAIKYNAAGELVAVAHYGATNARRSSGQLMNIDVYTYGKDYVIESHYQDEVLKRTSPVPFKDPDSLRKSLADMLSGKFFQEKLKEPLTPLTGPDGKPIAAPHDLNYHSTMNDHGLIGSYRVVDVVTGEMTREETYTGYVYDAQGNWVERQVKQREASDPRPYISLEQQKIVYY